jgi:predicted  nucleic acid-binding Zn-ribbon protein
MSDLLGDIEVSFPKTVTACHAEIKRLQDLVQEADEQLTSKEERIDELEREVDDLEDDDDDYTVDTIEAINALLDECERTGPLRYDVPQTDRVNRAIVKLHEVTGRNP